MRRFNSLGFSPNSLLRNFLIRRHFQAPVSVKSAFDRQVSSGTDSSYSTFQRALLHQVRGGTNSSYSTFRRALLHRGDFYNCSYDEKHAELPTIRMLEMNRFIHATGCCYSPKRDYYEILGVSKDASRDEIKKAFHADLLASFLRGENFNFGLCEERGKQELVVWMLWFNNLLNPNCEIC